METDLLAAFQDCAVAGADEVRVAALVARLLDPRVVATDIESRLNDLAGRCDARLAPWEALDDLGFAGNRDDYEALENSNLAWVLAHRRGLPITLAVVLIRLARSAGRQAVGVNFPGHFLVDVDGTLVDPFVMQAIDVEGFLERLPADSRQQPRSRLFAQASPVTVGLRMLNNVKLVYSRTALWDRSLDVVDAQLALAPEQPALHLERGELWHRLGLIAPARASYLRALELSDASPAEHGPLIRQSAQARLDELGGADDVLH